MLGHLSSIHDLLLEVGSVVGRVWVEPASGGRVSLHVADGTGLLLSVVVVLELSQWRSILTGVGNQSSFLDLSLAFVGLANRFTVEFADDLLQSHIVLRFQDSSHSIEGFGKSCQQYSKLKILVEFDPDSLQSADRITLGLDVGLHIQQDIPFIAQSAVDIFLEDLDLVEGFLAREEVLECLPSFVGCGAVLDHIPVALVHIALDQSKCLVIVVFQVHLLRGGQSRGSFEGLQLMFDEFGESLGLKVGLHLDTPGSIVSPIEKGDRVVLSRVEMGGSVGAHNLLNGIVEIGRMI